MTIILAIAVAVLLGSTLYFWRKYMTVQDLIARANAAVAAANGAATTIATLNAKIAALEASAPAAADLQTVSDDLDTVIAKLTPAA